MRLPHLNTQTYPSYRFKKPTDLNLFVKESTELGTAVNIPLEGQNPNMLNKKTHNILSNYMTTKSYALNNVILTLPLLKYHIDLFWKDTFSRFYKDNSLFIIIVIKLSDGTYRTINRISKLTINEKDDLTSAALSKFNMKLDNYSDVNIVAIEFRYRAFSSDKLINTNTIIHNQVQPEDIIINTTVYKGTKLPVTMDLLNWGTITSNKGSLIEITSKINDIEYKYIVTRNSKGHNVSLYSNNNFILKFTDIRNEGGFTRTIDSMQYHYKNDQLVAKTHNKHFKYIKGINKDTNSDIKVITMDIETRTLDNVMIPYCICWFDGYNSYSYYLSDYSDVNDMLFTSITDMLRSKYNGYKIYIHNLSNFDGVFLLKVLANISSLNNIKLKISRRDDSIISIKLISKKCTLEFRDSYLLLTSSLRKLGKSFGVEDKSIFPYKFVNNPNIDIDKWYELPTFDQFDNITIDQYNEYCNTRKSENWQDILTRGKPMNIDDDLNTKFITYKYINEHGLWSLRRETIKYCIQDCVTLHQVITKFNTLIFNRFSININRYPTISSLAFGVYRSNFMFDKIPMLSGPIFDFIRKAYTGGAVDMYKPTSIPMNSDVYAYDVNSLYPTVMLQNDMPIGSPKYFEFNGKSLNLSEFFYIFGNKPFGFFNVEITVPKNIKHPILQTRVKTSGGYRTVAPLGKWTDVMFSEEIYNAINFGYDIKVLNGYIFDKANIFKDYINNIYEIKKNSSKDDPMYFISKLLLNSLYGRFGMDYKHDNHILISHKSLDNLIQNDSVEVGLPTDIDYDLVLVSALDKSKYDELYIDLNHTDPNVSISISAAISSYSRIFMSKFKNCDDYTLFYSDTDSIYISKELDSNYVGDELGQFKLEYIFKDSVFLAPKVYGGITTDDKTIIKIKGLSSRTINSDVTLDSLKTLLNKDQSHVFNQIKSFRNFDEGTIKLLEQTYNLIPTENKRQLVYKNNIFMGTKPYKIDNSKIIK